MCSLLTFLLAFQVLQTPVCCFGVVESPFPMLFPTPFFLITLGFLYLVFFLPILPSRLKVWRIALEVENLMPNSLAASLIVTSLEITLFINFSLTSCEIIEYFFLLLFYCKESFQLLLYSSEDLNIFILVFVSKRLYLNLYSLASIYFSLFILFSFTFLLFSYQLGNLLYLFILFFLCLKE